MTHLNGNESPEIKLKADAMKEFVNSWKAELVKNDYAGVIIIANAEPLQSSMDPNEKNLLQAMSGKTLAAPFTMFDITSNGDLKTKKSFTDSQQNCTAAAIEAIIELLQNEIKIHLAVLNGILHN